VSTSRAAAFIDRDGVLNALVPDPVSGEPESPLRPEDVVLLPGVETALNRIREAGLLLVGVSNQPAAAKGLVTVEELAAVQARVIELLAAGDASFDAFKLCLHHPDAVVPELAGPCQCRKPAPGMLLEVAEHLPINLKQSWMVGDTDSDVLAGQSAGCRTVLVEHADSAHKRSGAAHPDAVAPDLEHAVTVVLGDDSGRPALSQDLRRRG
jgi:D-glycero-D-manno-heptose 1,7-bisphosphate phosphatase